METRGRESSMSTARNSRRAGSVWGMIAGLILLSGRVVVAQNNQILTVSPSWAEPGTKVTVTFTLDTDAPPPPPSFVMPDSVMIGTLSASAVTHPASNVVTGTFTIPADETTGVKACSIYFAGPGITFSKADGFTVGTGPATSTAYTNGAPCAGYNLVSAINATTTYLMDNGENIVKTWTSSYTPGNAVYLLDDGTLMRTANTGSSDFTSGGAGGRVERFTWGGDLIWAFDFDTSAYRSHHDIEVLPNGNILMIAWELKTEAEAVAMGRATNLVSEGELWPDMVIEVAPTGSYGGEIVWEWHAWDHLIQNTDAAKPDYGWPDAHPERINLNYDADGKADWLHINAIDYNPELDQILLSVRNFSEIWIIDHSTTTAEAAMSSGGNSGMGGDLLYRWGNPAAYDDGALADQQLFVQHNAQWIEDGLSGAGNILIFNNGQGRIDGDYSSVVEIVPPIGPDGAYTNGLPLAPMWVYTNAVATNFYSSNISGAQRLPNGNTLICEGAQGYAFEVTSEGGLVWDYTHSASMFRFERYAPDFLGFIGTAVALPGESYAVVDTGQTRCFDNSGEISAPGATDPFYGQDGSHAGNPPTYRVSDDGLTVYDYNTGLTWTRSHDWDGDGDLDVDDKRSQSSAVTYAATLNAAHYGGHSDWRLPTIKELYSLMDFRGTDPDTTATNSSDLTPFIDTTVFEIGYGDVAAGERIIDSQFATTTIYVDYVMGGQQAMFGLNLVDGRIKGYPTLTGKTYYALYCRGNTNYGVNAFTDNGDGTVSDTATGLMWAQADAGTGMDWSNALTYAESSTLAGYDDWRLPNAKELQSLVDYTRSPSTTGSAAIDPVFSATPITNMANEADYPWYWSGTTHLRYDGSADSGVYVCFGRGLGTMDSVNIIDVHGAGCQRSDPKTGNAADYPSAGHGPQGDVQRVFNYVRLVRDLPAVADYDTDGVTDQDERNVHGSSPYDVDTDRDGMNDGDEVVAGTSLTDDTSYLYLAITGVTSNKVTVSWPCVAGDRTYRIYSCTNLLDETWVLKATTGVSVPSNSVWFTYDSGMPLFTRVTVENIAYINN